MANVISFRDVFAPSFWGAWNDFINYRYTDMWFTGGRGCIDGDTLIDTPSGKVKVRDFNGGVVYAYDGEKIVEAEACRPIRYTREDLFRVTLSNGDSILVTDLHRFLTPKGWIATNSLSVGDVVFSPDLNRLHSPSSSLCEEHGASVSLPSRCCQKHPAPILPSSFLKEPCDPLQKHCVEFHSVSHGGVLHLMRRLLGLIYRYWQDSRLCDGQPLREEDTYLDVFQRLIYAHEHTLACLNKGGLGKGSFCTHSCVNEFLLSMQDCLHRKEGICCEEKGTRILRMLFELISEIGSKPLLSQKSGDLSDRVLVAVRLLLLSIENLDSSEDGLSSALSFELRSSLGNENLQMLSDMLRHKVGDESFSDTFTIDDGDSLCLHKANLSRVVSVEYEKTDYYYDFFVPFYNNYIAHGFVNHNSTKSSFVTMCIVLGLERDAKEGFRRRAMGDKSWKSNMTHAIVYRKIAADLKDSVYNQFVWSIEKLGLQNEYEYKLSPLRIVKRRTQQMIYFKGLDDPMKSKSLKPPFSYYKYNFFEELDQFDGMEEVRSVRQSIMRGGHVFQSFAAFNPPETTANWANYEASLYIPTRKVYHSTYLGVPKEWLGPGFLQEAENLRNTNERAYRHEYLGEITGNGGAVFPNLVEREITDEELRRYDRLYLGLDFGFSLDPSAFTAMYYDQNHNRLIIFDEIYQTNLRNVELAEMIKAKPYVSYNYIMCDSAEPKSIADLEAYGINALAVVKTERRFGFKWLQSLDEIVVDKRRTPNVYREFSQAEYRKTVSGQFISDYPKINDHTIDSVRYGSSEIAANSGIF